jgi:hypothetical protein
MEGSNCDLFKGTSQHSLQGRGMLLAGIHCLMSTNRSTELYLEGGGGVFASQQLGVMTHHNS